MSRTPDTRTVQRAVYAARMEMIRRGSDLPVEPHVLAEALTRAVERGLMPSLKHEHVREFTRAMAVAVR